MTPDEALSKPALTADEVLARLRLRLPHLLALVQPHVHMRDVQLDSLDWVELLCVIDSEFHVRVTETDLQSLETVAALAQLITQRAADPAAQLGEKP